jgi:outer membrane protein OmpA-like peptidoglycan-associated protein
MLNVKELFESLSDAEKEELKKLLLHHTDDVNVQSSKEDTFANAEIIDPLQQNEEVTVGDQLDQIVNEAEAEVEEPESVPETTEIGVSEKQEFLVKFGYDPTNVKYMNADILDQAYGSALKIRDAEAGGETITGMPTEG